MSVDGRRQKITSSQQKYEKLADFSKIPNRNFAYYVSLITFVYHAAAKKTSFALLQFLCNKILFQVVC